MIKIKSQDGITEHNLPNDYFAKNKAVADIAAGTIIVKTTGNVDVTCDLNSIRVYQETNEELPIIIPKLKVRLLSDPVLQNLIGVKVSKIYASWNSPINTRFLGLNPRIWLFVWKNTRLSPSRLRKKSWRHPQHLNTHPFAGSSFYNGTMNNHPCSEIQTSGRKTQFFCPVNENEWVDIGFEQSDWFFPSNDAYKEFRLTSKIAEFNSGLITAITQTDTTNNKWVKGTNSRAQKSFRIAIVCDNPEYTISNKQSPVIIGELSDVIKITFDPPF
jgi:hypothetical protein